MGRPEKIRLGEILVQQKLPTPEQLNVALAEGKKSGRRLGRVVTDKGFVSEEQISEPRRPLRGGGCARAGVF